MKQLNLASLISEINAFSEERDWGKFHSPKNLAMALTVESSELLELYQWMSEVDSIVAHDDPVFREKLQDELADIFVYLLRIVSLTEIDLEVSVRAKLAKNAIKYPVEKSKGNSKKYNEL